MLHKIRAEIHSTGPEAIAATNILGTSMWWSKSGLSDITTHHHEMNEEFHGNGRNARSKPFDNALLWRSQDRNVLQRARTCAAIFLLFLNYFCAQYDKFILSYFQTEITRDLGIDSQDYGLLSGYAVGILYALCAIPVAYIADQSTRRVWVLSAAALWWSIMVIFQGLAHTYWQILLARIAMGIGQAASESLSVSLISDLLPPRWVPVGESIFYIGIYIGEAVSANISTAFRVTGTSWRYALVGVGVFGVVLGVTLFLIVAEPQRARFLPVSSEPGRGRAAWRRGTFVRCVHYLATLKSFWIITLGSSLRQLGGNVFGFYMPPISCRPLTRKPT